MTDNTNKAVKKWDKEDDAKLAALFRKGLSHGGISATDLNVNTIKSINDKYFKEREAKNFTPLFRAKARVCGARSKFMFVMCHT